jgi:cytochrome subunit of sulfide dehydrogenase
MRNVVLAACLLVLAAPVQAQEAPAPVLAAACGGCHGPNGVSPAAIPSIDKLDAATMTAKLNGFRSGAIEATVMNRIAKGYTDAEIAALVQYFTQPRR